MIILHDHVLSADCYKVRLMLAFLGVPYERRPVDMHPGRAHRASAFRALSPLGRLPVLEDGDLTIWEPQAALAYIAMRYDPFSSWGARDASETAAVQTWLQFAGGPLAALGAARAHALLGEHCTHGDPAEAITILDDHLVEQGLNGRAWLAAARPTIADVACFPDPALHEDAGLRLAVHVGVRRWLKAFMDLPQFVEMPGLSSA